MTHDEVLTLRNFTRQEINLSGQFVNWTDYHFPTMQHADDLREWVGSPCTLIRGDHNIASTRPYSADKATAIDLAFLKAPYSRVVMEVMRLPCSWGVYVGKSVHLDLRSTGKPARWMAFRPDHRAMLETLGLGSLFGYQSDDWLYLQWSSALSLKALYVLSQAADDIDGNLTF